MKYMISAVVVVLAVVAFFVFTRERNDGIEKEYESAETVIDFISRTQIRVDDELLEWAGEDTAYQVLKRFCGGMRVLRIGNAHRCMPKDVWSLCEIGRRPQRGHEELTWPVLFFKLEDADGKECDVFAGSRITHIHTFRFPKPICRIHAEDHRRIDDFDFGAKELRVPRQYATIRAWRVKRFEKGLTVGSGTTTFARGSMRRSRPW